MRPRLPGFSPRRYGLRFANQCLDRRVPRRTVPDTLTKRHACTTSMRWSATSSGAACGAAHHAACFRLALQHLGRLDHLRPPPFAGGTHALTRRPDAGSCSRSISNLLPSRAAGPVRPLFKLRSSRPSPWSHAALISSVGRAPWMGPYVSAGHAALDRMPVDVVSCVASVLAPCEPTTDHVHATRSWIYAIAAAGSRPHG